MVSRCFKYFLPKKWIEMGWSPKCWAWNCETTKLQRLHSCLAFIWHSDSIDVSDWPTFCVKSHLGTGCHGRAADSCHIHVLPRGISERLLGVESVQREIDLKLHHLYIYNKYMSKQKAIGKLWPVFLCLSCSHYFSSSPDQKVITSWLQNDWWILRNAMLGPIRGQLAEDGYALVKLWGSSIVIIMVITI